MSAAGSKRDLRGRLSGMFSRKGQLSRTSRYINNTIYLNIYRINKHFQKVKIMSGMKVRSQNVEQLSNFNNSNVLMNFLTKR